MGNNKIKACIAILLYFIFKLTICRKRRTKDWLKRRDNYSHTALFREIQLTDGEDYKKTIFE